MNTLLTIINDGDKLFDKAVKGQFNTGNPYWPDWDKAKSFFHSRELALVEGLKMRYEGMKVLDTADTIYKKIIGGDNIEGQVDGYNKALSLAIAELDEVITHLKK